MGESGASDLVPRVLVGRGATEAHRRRVPRLRASDTRGTVTLKNRRQAIEAIKLDRECVEPAGLRMDSEGVAWANIDMGINGENEAPDLRLPQGCLVPVALGAACWLVIIAAGRLVLMVFS